MFENIATVPEGQSPPALGTDAKKEFRERFDGDGKKGSALAEKD